MSILFSYDYKSHQILTELESPESLSNARLEEKMWGKERRWRMRKQVESNNRKKTTHAKFSISSLLMKF